MIAFCQPEGLRAGGIESWNTVEATVAHGSRWRLDCGGFVRLDHNVTYAYDDGVRCRTTVQLTQRFSLIGGMLSRWLDKNDKGHVLEERPFGGVGIMISKAPLRIESATEVERFLYPGGKPAYTRYRSRIEFEKPKRLLAPYLAEELFFNYASGLVRTRTTAGLRHRMEGGGRVECGYQFQNDLTNGAWVPKHAIRTAYYFGEIFRRH
ncbi:MAG: DUF2490 domain-containing protein [Bryobacteraceae bacterium]